MRQFGFLLASALALLLAACAVSPVLEPREAAPTATACPASLPGGSRCLQGRDSAGAFYLIAVPPHWQGALVLHAHGGPTLGPPKLERALEDLDRWHVLVQAGYAWAGSTFRQGGVAVRAAAEDTERVRRIFNANVARPRFTVLHGQSWGASVAAIGASMFRHDASGARPYDAVLLTSGVLAGGTRAYDFRLDLRVIYQALCGNHPAPSEPPYPLWRGLPESSQLTPAQLRQRVDDCLALDRPAAARTPDQSRKVHTLTSVLHIPESAIHAHLQWATFHFHDIAQRVGSLGSPFGNEGVRYTGSPDDDALNRVVLRYRADPRAVAQFGADTDPDGRIPVPVLTLHGIGDPTAFVEMEDTFAATLRKAGTAEHLVQAFTSDATHSYLTDAAYLTALPALQEWARGGPAPSPASLAARCRDLPPQVATGCRFEPDFRPAPLDSRVAPRAR
jgi:hypothetical protein